MLEENKLEQLIKTGTTYADLILLIHRGISYTLKAYIEENKGYSGHEMDEIQKIRLAYQRCCGKEKKHSPSTLQIAKKTEKNFDLPIYFQMNNNIPIFYERYLK